MASPYRPAPPPDKRSLLDTLFPVNPLEVAGGLMGLGTQAAGNAVSYMGSHTPLDALTPSGSAAPPGVQVSANQLGKDTTAMLDMPTEHVGPTVAAAVPIAAASKKLLPGGETVASTIAKRAKAPKDLPNVAWNPDTQAWEGGKVKGVPMEPPPHVTIPDIYDTKDPSLAAVPPVPQVELQRYEPAKGTTDRVADLISNAAVRAKMLEAIERGKGVGMAWHNSQPAIQDAIDALGSEEAGRAAFKRYIDYNAATSPLNTVPTNLREASLYYYRDKNDMGPVEVGSTPPDPYHGGLANQGHQRAVNEVLGGTFGQGDAAKVESYGANLEGNLTPVAMDRHAIRAPGILSEDPRWLQTQVVLPDKTKFRPQDEYNAGNLSMEDAVKRPIYWADMPKDNEYAALEDYYQGLAKDAKMEPG